MRVFLLFVDGLGVGGPDPEINPCAREGLRRLGCYRNGAHLVRSDPEADCIPVDTALGVPGLPQSATGQVSLLTGRNAPKQLGRHLTGFPNPPLRDLLKSYSLLKILVENGRTCDFLNTFRDPFFDLPLETQWRLSATTGAALAAGLKFHRPEDIEKGDSIYHDMTGESLRGKGFDVPILTVEEAAAIAARRSETFDLLLFEYFLTDRAGHSRNPGEAGEEIRKLDAFISGVLARVNLKETLLIVTSDHGNIEDVSTKSHTRNPVMTLAWGNRKSDFAGRVSDLTHITPAVLNLLGIHDRPA